MLKLLRAVALGLLIGVVAILIVGAIQFLVFSIAKTEPPPSTHDIPIYAGAQQFVVKDYGSAPVHKTISFATPDKPQAVLAFYQARLNEEGWNSLPAYP